MIKDLFVTTHKTETLGKLLMLKGTMVRKKKEINL